jgi:PAS domain S-box-containing protein
VEPLQQRAGRRMAQSARWLLPDYFRDNGHLMGEAVDDVTPAPKWAASISARGRQVWRAGALFLVYLAVYLALDRLSFIEPLHGIGITPWNPSTGLILALLIIKGPCWSPVVFAAELLSGAMLPVVPIPPGPVFVAAFVVTAGYAGVTATLRHAGFDAGFRSTRDVVLLLAVTIIGSGLVACGYVATYAAAGVLSWSGFPDAACHFWIGDAIGIVALAPPLLILTRPVEHSVLAGQGHRWLEWSEIVAQGASIALALVLVFSRVGGDHPFGLFYVLFLPLIWIAMRRGLAGASLAILAIQVGLIAELELQGPWEATLRAFQLLMLALAATGLILGAVVSERHRLSRALAKSEGRRRAILNTARDGVLTIDGLGRIWTINLAVERLFGRPGHLLKGHNIQELLDGPPDLLERMRRVACSRAIETSAWELYGRRAGGDMFPIDLSIGRCDPPGPEQYTLVIRDITLRRKVEARAREHQVELAHISRVTLAGEMAAALAHELSQPLTAIAAYARGCLRLLAETAPEAAILREGVLEVVQQAERAGDVLSRLREFVRGGARQCGFVDARSIIDTAVSLARAEATQHEIEIEAKIEPNLPFVLADHIQIEQVLLNLFRNAIEAIVTGKSHKRLIIVAARRKGAHALEISVADSGPGVADEAAGRLFEPFMTTKALGMGMGLAISRSIVESHGGSLRMVERAESGAIFAFDLPTDRQDAGLHAG